MHAWALRSIAGMLAMGSLGGNLFICAVSPGCVPALLLLLLTSLRSQQPAVVIKT
jgi:hypothetical protein